MIREIRIYVCDEVGMYCVEFVQDGNCVLNRKYALLPAPGTFYRWIDRGILPNNA